MRTLLGTSEVERTGRALADDVAGVLLEELRRIEDVRLDVQPSLDDAHHLENAARRSAKRLCELAGRREAAAIEPGLQIAEVLGGVFPVAGFDGLVGEPKRLFRVHAESSFQTSNVATRSTMPAGLPVLAVSSAPGTSQPAGLLSDASSGTHRVSALPSSLMPASK